MIKSNNLTQTPLFQPIDGLDIRKIIFTLYQHINFILLIAFCSMVLVFLHTLTLQPEYESSAMLRIATNNSNNSNFLVKMGYGSSEDSTGINTLVALIHTRYMLEPIIENSGLNISATPHYFPYFGEWIARHRNPDNFSKPFLGLKSYAWGGEKIQVNKFLIPIRYENQTFRLILDKNNHYKLYSSQNEFILEGKVGKEYFDKTTGINISISTLTGRPDTVFFIQRSKPLSLVNRLAHQIQINNVYGNDVNQGTGIFQVIFRDGNPDRTVSILNTIAKQIIENDAAEKSRGDKNMFALLDNKLVKLNIYLKKLENELNEYHIKNNTLSVSADGQFLIRQIKSLELSIDSLRTTREELLLEYTPKHPLVITNIAKESELTNQLNKLREKLKQFPASNQRESNLVRELSITTSLYASLLSKRIQMESLGNSKGSSDITILSDALPASLVPSKKLSLIIMGFLTGAFLAAILVILKNIFTRTIEGSEQIEDEFNMPVRAVLPFSRKQKALEQSRKKSLNVFGSSLQAPLILAKQEPDDLAVESFRSLRISLDLNQSHEKNKIISIMGSLSNIGKSFVSINLAQIMADSGRKTIIVDADVRKGRLHHVFCKPKSKGISEYLEGTDDYKNLIHSIDDNLFFIACGSYTSHPLKLFQSTRYSELIDQLKKEFDQIIIDTPPLLPVSDALLIAKYSSTNLLVVSAGADEVSAIRSAIKKANSHDIILDGFILNHRKSLVSSGAQHYQYAYGE